MLLVMIFEIKHRWESLWKRVKIFENWNSTGKTAETYLILFITKFD